MKSRVEHIGRARLGPDCKKSLKKQTVRARRRAEKVLLEDAPTQLRHLVRGYAD